ncbi:MAG: adenylosuccinate lyase family protein, partial [Alphaproteobacteria bacterium]|nr:adenylosuccinate lyase family protein [Alphaproteobacteria bacterium]
IDSGLMLRLRRAVEMATEGLDRTLTALAELADTHAETPMVARTYGQHATPSSFGKQVADWGAPLLQLRQDRAALERHLCVSLSGAAGTGSALGADPADLRKNVAAALGLTDPGRSWHTDRGPFLALCQWATQVMVALAKMGEDLILMTQPERAEVTLGRAGSSSTMPQKQNPVQPSMLVALARHAAGLIATLTGASIHKDARDGAAWFTEWLAMPQLFLSLGAAVENAASLAETLAPNPKALAAPLQQGGGLVFAETLSFALAARMPRPDAQAAVKALCASVRDTGGSLEEAARREWPDLDGAVFDPSAQLGTAPADARDFAAQVRALAG